MCSLYKQCGNNFLNRIEERAARGLTRDYALVLYINLIVPLSFQELFEVLSAVRTTGTREPC